MYITQSFTPQEMFHMVWEIPVLILAREIGVSDVVLAKACRRAGIVLPSRAAGQNLNQNGPRNPSLQSPLMQ